MTSEPSLIVQVPRGSSVELQLSADPPPSLTRDEILVEVMATDEHGNLDQPPGGDVVLSVPSPEALRRQADEVGRVIGDAGPGSDPLVVVVEAAEELREDELAGLLAAARHSARPLILRIIRGA